MIINPDWQKAETNSSLHQISLDCLEKLGDTIEQFNRGEIDDAATFKVQKQIVVDEITDPELLEFATDNLNELLSYIESGRVNIRIHRNSAGEIWFGMG